MWIGPPIWDAGITVSTTHDVTALALVHSLPNDLKSDNKCEVVCLDGTSALLITPNLTLTLAQQYKAVSNSNPVNFQYLIPTRATP